MVRTRGVWRLYCHGCGVIPRCGIGIPAFFGGRVKFFPTALERKIQICFSRGATHRGIAHEKDPDGRCCCDRGIASVCRRHIRPYSVPVPPQVSSAIQRVLVELRGTALRRPVWNGAGRVRSGRGAGMRRDSGEPETGRQAVGATQGHASTGQADHPCS